MNLFRRFKSAISLFTILAMASFFTLPAHAAMISNASIVEQTQHQLNKQDLLSQLDRAEVQNELTAMGVNIDDAKMRVAQMTNQEIADLSSQFDQLPAGSGILGAVVVVFVVRVITDMLGATDVFGFVHNINHR